MIKSLMEFLDILFPVNLNPLTYRCPDAFLNVVEPGMIVSAPLKNKFAKGIILGKSLSVPSGDIKGIQKVHGDTPILNSHLITLLKWMSEYYLATQGIVLKNMLPKEAFTKIKPRKTEIPPRPPSLNIINIADDMASNLTESINKNAYRAFLLHAPTSLYEYSFLMKVLIDTKNAIILLPEVFQVNNLYPFLKEGFGERVCLFHGRLSKGRRSEVIERIVSGHSDIVLGTRSAVFAPLKKVSFIAVLHEHSSSYKQEDGLCYNARDVAVMRGYLEKSTVLLSSICPSSESLYNCKTGKYTLLKPAVDIKKPKVRIIDMRHEKLLKPYLSKRVVDTSLKYINNNKKVMFVLNRRGYSTLLQCNECGHIERCPECKIPIVFHKHEMLLKCHYCNYKSPVPESCSRCKSYNIQLLGVGTQKAQEDIEALIRIKTLRLDSDRVKKKSELEELIGATYRDDVRIIIGTKLMTRRLDTQGFSMAALLNTDIFLNLPDFRSTEKAYQEISSIIDKIVPDGEIFIQTRMPENYLFKYLRGHDYTSFFKEEMKRRKTFLYPPYSRLLLLKFISKRDMSRELSEIINRIDEGIEILGPAISKNAHGRYEFKLLLKSSIRGRLHSVAGTFIEAFKESKDIKIKVDVDPLNFT